MKYMFFPRKYYLEQLVSLIHVDDGFRKIIVAGDRYTSGYNDDGILIVGLYDFLLGKVDIWKQE